MCAAKIHMMILIINYFESVECSRYTSRKTRSGILSVFFENNTYISLQRELKKILEMTQYSEGATCMGRQLCESKWRCQAAFGVFALIHFFLQWNCHDYA
ncbi:hypothetical protein D4758_00075 [Enterocloster citroniae]|nr:hypothetical protein [Enterocloster citroniae]